MASPGSHATKYSDKGMHAEPGVYRLIQESTDPNRRVERWLLASRRESHWFDTDPLLSMAQPAAEVNMGMNAAPTTWTWENTQGIEYGTSSALYGGSGGNSCITYGTSGSYTYTDYTQYMGNGTPGQAQ